MSQQLKEMVYESVFVLFTVGGIKHQLQQFIRQHVGMEMNMGDGKASKCCECLCNKWRDFLLNSQYITK
jgi:hypothetical protein